MKKLLVILAALCFVCCDSAGKKYNAPDLSGFYNIINGTRVTEDPVSGELYSADITGYYFTVSQSENLMYTIGCLAEVELTSEGVIFECDKSITYELNYGARAVKYTTGGKLVFKFDGTVKGRLVINIELLIWKDVYVDTLEFAAEWVDFEDIGG